MKANRKFRTEDDAVSPVIAVILMVAITVVLAATVYVWVSGFGAQSGTPAKTISLSSAGAIQSNANATSDQTKNFTVASASSGLRWADITFTFNGVTVNCLDDWDGTADKYRVKSGASYLDCTDTAAGPSSVVTAGQIIEFYDDGGSLSGKSLRILDSQANSVILTLVIG